MNYAQQLKDPRWQRRRLEILSRADFSCEECGSQDKTLHVHHKLYRKGAKAWEYEDAELVSLCEDCHSLEHATKSQLDALMAQMDIPHLQALIGYSQSLTVVKNAFNTDQKGSLLIQSEAQAYGLADGLDLGAPEVAALVESKGRYVSFDELMKLSVAAARARSVS